MSNSDARIGSGGIGFTGALTLLFIGLKLGHVIDWEWLWVLSPVWISFVVAGVFLVGFFLMWMAAFILETVFDR